MNNVKWLVSISIFSMLNISHASDSVQDFPLDEKKSLIESNDWSDLIKTKKLNHNDQEAPLGSIDISNNYSRKSEFNSLYQPLSQLGSIYEDKYFKVNADEETNLSWLLSECQSTKFSQPGNSSCVVTESFIVESDDQVVGVVTAQNYSLNALWTPTEAVAIGLQYFDVSPNNYSVLIPRIGAQTKNVSGKHRVNPQQPAFSSSNQHLGTKGVDLNIALGGQVKALGELSLNVNLKHIQNGTYNSETLLPNDAFLQHNGDTTEIGFGLESGDFGAGITSRYLNSHDELSQSSNISMDLKFSWNTPWKGNIELGAKNIFSNEETVSTLKSQSKEVEQLFGKMPYVQYKIDL